MQPADKPRFPFPSEAEVRTSAGAVRTRFERYPARGPNPSDDDCFICGAPVPAGTGMLVDVPQLAGSPPGTRAICGEREACIARKIKSHEWVIGVSQQYRPLRDRP